MQKEPTVSVWNKFWNRKKDLEKVYPSSPSVLKAILNQGSVEGLKILEVGAGTGRDSLELAKAGAQVFILDYSEESLKITRELALQAPGNLHLVQGDAFNAPFPSETFDIVFHQGLAEHFKNPLPLLKENARLLKKGGFCLCDVPQTFHLYTVLKQLLIALDKWFAGWETQFTMPQLRKLMKSAGLEVVYEYGDWMRPNLIYRIIREIGFKLGIELPKYPLNKTLYQKWKDELLDTLSRCSISRYTQVCIGVIGRKN
ncbi:MAG: methyltransferase domain-containing protein [Fibromonadaceae bacterium]|jgi:ubiquinone/menaquinone biosynthesis C-methylase UbiE|nr:methyltransferase domain-containing protein [Fibromonadaceae bacterium]